MNLVATMLATSVAFGEEPTPCWEAYLQSGLSQRQMGFEEFRELYSDSVCAPDSRRTQLATSYPAEKGGERRM